MTTKQRKAEHHIPQNGPRKHMGTSLRVSFLVSLQSLILMQLQQVQAIITVLQFSFLDHSPVKITPTKYRAIVNVTRRGVLGTFCQLLQSLY